MARGSENVRQPRRFWTAIRLLLLVTASCGVLVIVALVAGRSAAMLALAAILWVALFRLWKAERRWQVKAALEREEVSARYDAVVSSLLAALGLSPNLALRQSRRVSQLVAALSWQMGLRKPVVVTIEKAAILHDVGKIGIAETVLSKPGELTAEEWSEMKRHPELGNYILRGIKDLEDAAEIVYSHHERYDGAGYPRGLRGTDIPIGARIFAVVDAYVAMTSHRPYRKVRPHSEAMQEILRNAGSQFDPEVVRAFRDAEERGLLEPETLDGDGVGPAPPAVRSEV